MILFFDTETTGTPLKYDAPISDLNNWPRVIQLAWAAYDNDGELLDYCCSLIKPNGWEMPTGQFWIDNGFSQFQSMAEGVDIEHALQNFILKINQSDTLVAHNMSFDFPIMCAEMIRAGLRAENKPEKYCTMRSTTYLCQIPGPRGYKWPKLEELHRFLFNEGFDGAHDALNDVKATARCYFELKKRNLLVTKIEREKIIQNNIPSVNEL